MVRFQNILSVNDDLSYYECYFKAVARKRPEHDSNPDLCNITLYIQYDVKTLLNRLLLLLTRYL